MDIWSIYALDNWQREKLQKAALKAEALEMKKVQKEKQKWEKGKLALKSIVAEIDTKVVEIGSVGGMVCCYCSIYIIVVNLSCNTMLGNYLVA